MKKELEIKDIVNYIPYNLQCKTKDSEKIVVINTIPSIADLNNLYPILHPLTDLFKPIIIENYNNNECFIPMDELCELIEIERYTFNLSIYDYDILDKLLSNKELEVESNIQILDYLNRWKFDYRNLITRGLAIDINEFIG